MTHMQSVNPNTVVVIHHHRHVQIPFRVVQPVAVFHPVVVAQPVVVAPVSVVQPVMVAQPVVVTVTPSFPAIIVTAPYPWSSYGPNWNAGWTLAQTQQLCQSYVQTVQTNPTAFNQYVQAICVGSSSTPY
jgi:hypothetical protein